jgi:hypothetical protein
MDGLGFADTNKEQIQDFLLLVYGALFPIIDPRLSRDLHTPLPFSASITVDNARVEAVTVDTNTNPHA